MKTILLSTILFSLSVLPAVSQLSDTDLDKIKLIINDVVKKEIAESEARLKDYMNVRFESIDKRFEGVDKQFESVDKRFESVNKSIESVDKRITHVTNISYGLIALIVVAVGIPQIISVWQGGSNGN